MFKHNNIQKNDLKKKKHRQEQVKKLADRYLLKMLINRNVHYSFHKKYLKKEFQPYLHCFFNDYGIINLKKTISQLRIATHILHSMAVRDGHIIIVDSPYITYQDLEKIITTKKIKFLKRSRWVPGLLSNQQHVRNSMTNYISKKVVKKDKEEFYHSMLQDLHKVQLLVITDPVSCADLIHEAFCAHVPVMAFVDLNSSLSNITYPIVCNNQTHQSVLFLLEILQESFKRGAKAPEPFEKDFFKKKEKLIKK